MQTVISKTHRAVGMLAFKTLAAGGLGLTAVLAVAFALAVPSPSLASPARASVKATAKGEEGHKEDGHKEGEEEEGHDSELRLTDKQIALAGIRTVTVAKGQLQQTVDLAGEVQVNIDRVVQVVPRVQGVVAAVRAHLGDHVEKGAVLAVVESREFADAVSAYVAARERAKLATIKFEREGRLFKKKISSEQEYLDAEIALTEARIAERTAAQKLLALGLSDADLESIAARKGRSLTRYEVVAPLSGTVIEKHVSAGGSVDPSDKIYRIADLKTLWVIASVYEKDIARIKLGQKATVRTRAFRDRTFAGRITWIADVIDETTRTLKVRIAVDNSSGLLKPGMFVRASVVVEVREGVLTVPVSAVRRQGGETIVFVAEEGGRFERREVVLGGRSGEAVEVVSGLEPGQKVVSAGSFILKSELEKEGFGGGHGH